MGAMALRLDVRLRKPGVYALHAAGRSPEAADLVQALRLARSAARIWTGVLAGGLAAGALMMLTRLAGGPA